MESSVSCCKIAFVGTSCIGKTTLLEEIRQRLGANRTAVFVREAARVFFTLNPLVRERFSVQAQAQVQALALQQEREAHATSARLIFCDRSVMDAVAYLRAEGDRTGARELLERIRFWLPTYSAFALLDPGDIHYQSDAIRQEDEATRQRFHHAFLDFFREEQLAYTLFTGTLEERIVQCNQLLVATGSQIFIPLKSTQPS
jgi:nicotinamide riboside kinase